jgi:CubicO group peptidase (beta-lactamase class C family)
LIPRLRFAAVILVTAASCRLLSLPLRAQGRADARFEALASLVTQKMAEYHIPGVALGVVEEDSVAVRGFGVTSTGDEPMPISLHTVFPIASISKTIAATAMLRLVEQGKVDLHAPVRKYLPDFRVQDEAVSRDVTVWHLLTHTSGWEGQVAPPDRGEQALKAFVDGMPTLMQLAPPGAAWSYNNAGFSVAGRVIEVVTGQSINAAIRDLVLIPLGLEHAGTNPAEFLSAPRFALGHFNRGDGPATPQRPFAPSTSLTAGGVGLCITDLMTYARFHLGDGAAASGERVLTKASLDLMKTPQLRKQGNDDDIGLPWHLRRVNGVLTAAHGGTLGGHILLLELLPDKHIAFGILTNASGGWRLIQDVERAALKSYADATYAKNQAIAHRGLVETLPSVEPLATQPDPAPYIGRYQRPMNTVVVRAEAGRVFVQVRPNSGEPQPEMAIRFYGPDRAVVAGGADQGQSIEFVRASDGRVKWVRVTGRIAVRETEK